VVLLQYNALMSMASAMYLQIRAVVCPGKIIPYLPVAGNLLDAVPPEVAITTNQVIGCRIRRAALKAPGPHDWGPGLNKP